MPTVSASASFREGAINFNTWVLYIQYAACFGVELTMNNASATYFNEEFGLSTAKAAAVASIFGFMNIFARGLGGFLSDKACDKLSVQGRIIVQMVLLLLEGACIFIFANMQQLWAAILLLTIFSIFVQGAEGSTYGTCTHEYGRSSLAMKHVNPCNLLYIILTSKYSAHLCIMYSAHFVWLCLLSGIVPYVNPSAQGAVAGIVGAGGPSGAVLFGLGFRQLSTKNALYLMASVVVFSGFLSFAIIIKGYRGLIFGTEEDHKRKIAIPTGLDVNGSRSGTATRMSAGPTAKDTEHQA